MKYKSFYLLSLAVIVLSSAYPVYMGTAALASYLQKGYISAGNYPKYIIPYTPICIALIASIALMPLFFKLFKRRFLPLVSLFGTALFFAAEYGFEQIRIIGRSVEMPLESWQLSLCMATPEVLRSIGEPIYAADNPAFKIHFYIIAVIIILAVLNVVYGLSKMLIEQDFTKKRPLLAQAVSVVFFISLCIFACFTAFYRNGTINISPLSAALMTIFFIVFGITAGIYFGSIFYGKGRLLSKLIPSIAASLTTLLMYIGELVLMGGVLFRYGSRLFFQPLPGIPFSAADFTIILSSGIITYIVMQFLDSTLEAG